MKIIQAFITLLAIAVFTSCETTQEEKEEVTKHNTTIELTQQQFENGKMQLGSPQPHTFMETVKTNGTIQTSSKGKAQISVHMSGKVTKLNSVEAQYVKKGERLFSIESNEIIQLQQAYMQNRASLEYAKINLDRFEQLNTENITAKKEYQKAKMEYLSIKAEDAGLAKRLQLLNLDPNTVAQGEILASIPVVAPISGTITSLEIVNGHYLHPEDIAMEIVDNSQLQLRINLFEKDASTVTIGQAVKFYTPDNKESAFEAQIIRLGKTVHPDKKTIECIAEISPETIPNLYNKMYVESEVITCQRESMAIPSEAIINDGYQNYVLVKASQTDDIITFKKQKVEIGRHELEYTEILTEGLSAILVKGAYNLVVEN